ncbi:hypothetical protein H310_09584 [Aphanomyces invadans]|uniref:Uncharacterized protein n=1 Tax=Aphanomyces invadans TaxID=157072 RepID=A0A024TUN6_9STRA|nr:hypothetical protein H310_09584 [Aphanomyces invadans]ETV97699.1 hypothetical protein H310_09584 [Aphanomyces invadans]|eukprot:XP_008873908.1 hypothetical protein H310_09584 [Aphanomyces invadans]
MDEAEFSRRLAQFPVVRKKTHCRVAWKSETEVKTVSSITELGEGASKRPRVDMPFNTALEAFLEEFFTPAESGRIRKEFEKAQTAFLNGLCLEDMEEIAAQFKAAATTPVPSPVPALSAPSKSTIPNTW